MGTIFIAGDSAPVPWCEDSCSSPTLLRYEFVESDCLVFKLEYFTTFLLALFVFLAYPIVPTIFILLRISESMSGVGLYL